MHPNKEKFTLSTFFLRHYILGTAVLALLIGFVLFKYAEANLLSAGENLPHSILQQ